MFLDSLVITITLRQFLHSSPDGEYTSKRPDTILTLIIQSLFDWQCLEGTWNVFDRTLWMAADVFPYVSCQTSGFSSFHKYNNLSAVVYCSKVSDFVFDMFRINFCRIDSNLLVHIIFRIHRIDSIRKCKVIVLYGQFKRKRCQIYFISLFIVLFFPKRK